MAHAVLFTARDPGPYTRASRPVVPATSVTPAASPRWRRAGRFMLRLAVNLSMLVLVAAFTLVAVLPATGARAMIVLSGSMEPLLAAGDAAIIRDVPVEDLQAGDVITFHPIGADKRLTTHRIIDRVDLPNGLHFQTQGDANATPDVDLAPARNVVGRYEGMIPHGGRVLLQLTRPEAKIGLIALPALFFLVGEIRSLLANLRQRRIEQPERGGAYPRFAFGAAVLVLAAAAGVAATMTTMAVLTDAATVSENTLSTASSF